ncbi:growth-regulating factor 1-like [Pyrus ussuriensis x Pyrus communis]|uniref:Growth-regulating factor n=1 Tax=Pyrus ussuriensis x Pyrus communis TaxID=2448454 RepID=A0A5N5GX94_9ROSA|nr:growth-regulating factor 1-like [Pyrus ussuriensis x Pyrus communis]
MSSTGRSGRFPFTPSQWQELEHQALIYKYMVSGISIPPDLLFSLKRSSCSLDSPLPPKIFSHHPPHIGWNCFQMGLGRKIDPEPGRCRRTDGKKWRCSKEAFLDSKYCERHMHRGKNRSRKPVEVLKTSKSSNTSTITTKINTCSASPSPAAFHSLSSSLSSLSSSDSHPYPFLYHHHSPSPRPPGIGFPHQERNTTSLFLDSGSYPQPSSEYRNRYAYGMKEEVDEHAFFSEPSGTVRRFSGSSSLDDSWQFTPLTISTSSSSKQRSCSAFQSDQQDQQLQSIKHQSKIIIIISSSITTLWTEMKDPRRPFIDSSTNGPLKIKIRGSIWMINHRTADRFPPPGSQSPFLRLVMTSPSSPQDITIMAEFFPVLVL